MTDNERQRLLASYNAGLAASEARHRGMDLAEREELGLTFAAFVEGLEVRVLPEPVEVLPLVVADLTYRVDVVGHQEYERPFTTDDGRDALQDLYEELLDAVMYLRKLKAERGA